MKKLILPAALLMAIGVNGQGFVNGSFESTTSTGCDYNNSIASFNAKMDNVVMYDGWETDIHQTSCYIPSVPDGSKAIGMSTTDAINLELTDALISGEEYTLTFWKYGNLSFSAVTGTMEIGATEDPSIGGTVVGTVSSIASSTWEEHTISFIAPNNGTHISIKNVLTSGVWNQVDDFSIILACDALTTSVSATSICVGETVTLEASSDFGGTVSWNLGVVDGVAFEPPVGVTTYIATSDNPDDCQFSVDITVHELPTVTASVGDDEICLGDDFVFTGGGAATYTWDMGVTNGVSFIPGETGTETYTVTGTDVNGCVNSTTISATVHGNPEVIGSVDDDEICLGDSYTFTGSGAVTYTWFSGPIDGVPYTPGYAGLIYYQIFGTDANGCIGEDTVYTTVHALPTITASVDDDAICFGESVIFTGSGADTYDWDMGVTDGEAFTPLTSGSESYTVTGTDVNGCENTASVDVDVNEEIIITYTTVDETMGDGEIDLTVTGGTPGYTFDWDTDEADDFDDPEDLTDLSAGFYTVVVRDANGCEATEIIEIVLLCTPLTVDISDEVICETELLTLDATSISGADITWDGGAIDGEGFYPEMTGILTYTATSADPLDCPMTVNVEVLTAPIVNPTIGGETYCDGDEIVLGAGGDADTYSWSPLDFTPAVGVTTYTLTGVYDATGCERTATIDVTVNELPTVEATADNEVACIGTSVVLSGTGAIDYAWDPADIENGEAYTPDAVGTYTYTVTGTDANGCENSDAIDITITEEITISYVITDEMVGGDGSIDITISGGSPAYVFDWDNDGTGDFDDTEDLTGLTDGFYNVVVEGEAGCSSSAVIWLGSQLSVEELALNKVSLYPNPTTDQITIALEGTFAYSIFDAAGKLILTGNATDQEKLSLRDLPAGVYLVQIQNDKQVETVRFVKN